MFILKLFLSTHHGGIKFLLKINSRRMRWAGEGRDMYRVLVGKPEGKKPLGRPTYRWEDNIKMDLQ
jgi:hypothetical protein